MFAPSGLGAMFSPANLLGQLVFGAIGTWAFLYGKGQMSWRAVSWGLALMAFPYVVPNTVMLYLVGSGLTAGFWFTRDG